MFSTSLCGIQHCGFKFSLLREVYFVWEALPVLLLLCTMAYVDAFTALHGVGDDLQSIDVALGSRGVSSIAKSFSGGSRSADDVIVSLAVFDGLERRRCSVASATGRVQSISLTIKIPFSFIGRFCSVLRYALNPKWVICSLWYFPVISRSNVSE